ncbi:hypothetical protein [Asaia prunellae]|uniref:hypothetical protein n=1 Tax=Asaia prunellae TaxID=610245 RepID=UPI00068568AC|nr:hypothetical protein [Asaia prunellae]
MPAIMLQREGAYCQATGQGKQQQHCMDMVRHAREKNGIAGKQPAYGGYCLKETRGMMRRLIGFDGTDI